MMMNTALLAGYFALLFVIGWLARTSPGATSREFYLGGSPLRTLPLIATLAATNFSAFTVFGCSGAGYRDGLAFIPIMAFGTGFMALTFWLIGRKAWRFSRESGLITPAELISKLYDNKWLSLVFAIVMIVWTVPYLALQPLAGGMILQQMFDVPHLLGALVITLIVVLYTMSGGFRAVAWTDVFQGLLLLSLMIVALVTVASSLGGFEVAMAQVLELSPELLSRPGGQGTYVPVAWLGIMLLWFFCDPMFPQMFQRFYCANSEAALARTMVLYPIVTSLVFVPPVLLGVLGTLRFPALEGKAADNILPLLMSQSDSNVMGPLVLIAGLAALMSTMDSQLLTSSSIFVRDIMPAIGWRTANSVLGGRIFVAVLALGGLLIAVNPPSSILEIGLTAFTGLAGLFPTVLFGLYLRNPSPASGLVSILSSQVLLISSHMNWIPLAGVKLSIAVMVIAVTSFLTTQVLLRGWYRFIPTSRRSLGVSLSLVVIFILSMDFWNWGSIAPVWLGLPYWIWFSFGLSVLQVAISSILLRKRASSNQFAVHGTH